MVSPLQKHYDQLLERYKEMTVLRTAGDIIYWDMETKMPAKGLELRSEQLSFIGLTTHKMVTDRKIGTHLDAIEKDKGFSGLSDEQKRNVHLQRKMYDEESKLPDALVAEMSKQQILAVGAWKKAKAAKDYALFRNDLAKNIELKRRAAEILMEAKGAKTPYDAMLDLYEPGMTADRISRMFGGMRTGLIKILQRVDAGDRPDQSFLFNRVSIDAQRKISQMAMDFLGYQTTGPEAWGRLDETEHPFSNGYYNDVRVTTHYYEDNFKSSLFSVLHECGHALYESQMPAAWIYQPIGSAASYGIHESQSRFVENMVGRSPEFLAYILPKLKRVAGKALAGVGLEDFVRAVNVAERSKIRIEADEVTYGLHIIIRFELEKDIFAGKVTVDELPQAWNDKYAKYLGVEIEDDAEGVMQDTHWAGGSFGYFPSYALGNIYGGMFLEKMERDVPDWRSAVEHGDFSPVRTWLRDNVHAKGNMYDPADLIKVVTGKSISTSPFLNYLGRKVDMIYGQ
ncbi:MAG: carboxypeptidase M32 [Methanomassiliicoccus sp.]|nr:carboxypeptidase M32 [Methanomassiliicoccus sp.]